MSCSVHDVVVLEDRGVPAVAIHTHTFLNSAIAHGRAYGRPDLRPLTVRGPIANVARAMVRQKAERVLDEVVAALTSDG